MDSLINAAARALAAGAPLAALKQVALRDDAPALALRGIAMAQLGDLPRASDLLRRAARAFGPREPLSRARCTLAAAEVALVSRDLAQPSKVLDEARTILAARGDRANAAHAGYLKARLLLLIGRLDAAEQVLEEIELNDLPPASLAGYWLTAAGIAMRRIRSGTAAGALEKAEAAARIAAVPSLRAEVDQAARALQAPAARLLRNGRERLVTLTQVEALIASNTVIVDACRGAVRAGEVSVSLAGRPVLLALARTLAEVWPKDAPREMLLARAFRAKQADETHRARLRVEIGRLRAALKPLVGIVATQRGFALEPRDGRSAAVIAPPVEDAHADLLALLGDGESWSTSALSLALDVSPRTVQRALDTLARDGKVMSFGRGRACRWITANVPGFPTGLLLPAPSLGR